MPRAVRADRRPSLYEVRDEALELAPDAVSAEGLETVGEGAEVAAGGQRTLGAEIARTTRMMVAQGVEAVRVAEKIIGSRRKAAEGRRSGGGIGGMGGGLVALGAAAAGVKALEAGASLEQLKSGCCRSRAATR